jgi:hypothetical protein
MRCRNEPGTEHRSAHRSTRTYAPAYTYTHHLLLPSTTMSSLVSVECILSPLSEVTPMAITPPSTSKGGLRPKRATPGDAEPLIFDILNIFCCHWFLSKDHLLTNVILAQKAEDGNISWVEFTPQYHSAPTWSSVLSHLYLTLFTR